MRIAIIGAGYTGLTAGYRLSSLGHIVKVYETQNQLGGLAGSFLLPGWSQSLEQHYHHIFTSDKHILDLAQEIGVRFVFKTPISASYLDSGIYKLDDPLSVLQFPLLSPLERLRMAISLASLRFNPYWRPLEHIQAYKYLETTMGKKAFSMLWKPLIVGKFGKYAKTIPLSWFWARIRARTQSLGYPVGGFANFHQKLADRLKINGGQIFFNSSIKEISLNKDKLALSCNNKVEIFDKIIFTGSAQTFAKLADNILSEQYKNDLNSLDYLGAITLVLVLKKPFLTKPIYWLNMCHPQTPFLALVEHTNFISSTLYDNKHIVYIGNYLSPNHKLFELDKNQIYKRYLLALYRLNPNFEENLDSIHVFKAHFAQPVATRNYSRKIPNIQTPVANLYLANMQQIYPWDRGTNFAVELGNKVAKMIERKSE